MGKAIYKNGEYVLDTPDFVEPPVEQVIENTETEKTEPVSSIKVETEKK